MNIDWLKLSKAIFLGTIAMLLFIFVCILSYIFPLVLGSIFFLIMFILIVSSIYNEAL